MGKTEVRIEFISEGFRDILCCDGTKELVKSVTDEVCSNANSASSGTFTSEVTMVPGWGGGRWIGNVDASDKQARIDEAENKVLTGAIR